MTKSKIDWLKFALIAIVIGTIWPATDPWFSGWKYFTLGFCIYYSLFMAQKFSFPIGLAVGWTLYSGVRIFTDKGMYAALGGEVARSMDTVALKAVLMVVFLTVLMQASKKHLDFLKDFFGSICTANAMWVIIEWMLGFRAGGFLGNPSINATFIAMSYPIVAMARENNPYDGMSIMDAYRTHYIRIIWDMACFVAPMIAIFLADSSVPVGVLAVVMVAYVLLEGGDIKGINTLQKKIGLASLIVLTILAIASWKVSALFNTTGRWGIWELSMKWLFEKEGQWTGTGLGTYFLWGPHLQHSAKLGVGTWWIWMHSDPMQAIFETGLWGFFIYILAYFYTLARALRAKENALAICLLGFGAGSCFNFPSHIALTAFFVTFVIAKIHAETAR